MRRLIFGLLLLTATPSAAQMDWGQPTDPYNAAFGLSAGLTSGSGLSIRWPFLPQTMATVAGGIWGRSDSLAWNTGIELHYILRQNRRLRFFVGPAVAFYSDADEDDVDANISGGIGIEWLAYDRVSFKLDLGFTYQSDTEETYPLPQAAVFFYF